MSHKEAVEADTSNSGERGGTRLGGPEKKAAAASGQGAKASPDQVIGRKRPMGRLNKRLILGVIAAIGIGMLILNFLPTDKKGNGSGNSPDAVYANDSMPQDVKEMAMRLPEVKLTSAAPLPTSGFGRTSPVTGPFAGYPSGSNEIRPTSARSSAGEAAGGAGKDYSGMAAADARLEAERAARRAPMEVATKLTAGLAISAPSQAADTSTAGSVETPALSGSAVPTTSGQVTPYVVGSAVPQVAYTPGEIYRDLNDQQTKVAFSAQKAEAAAPNVVRPVDPTLLPYTIFAGTIIPAALETRINTDLPGDVLAMVAENVYDSVSGKNLLIPQGSKLLAKYSSNISFGQNRVQVAWQRLIRPDGLSLQLANMNGVDPQGMSGYAGYVDQHWWEYAKGIGLMALFSIIDGQLQYSMKTANSQGVSDIANSVTAGIDQVGTQFTANAMNIQPTITVNQGAKVQVFVNSDIIMPPANQKSVSKKYSIPKKEGGTQ
jgi:type IV secretion system protein VirB10